MEEIKLLFFILSSFFSIENERIAADKTEVRIFPQEQKIEIFQENLFALIQSKNDEALVLKQWDSLYNWKQNKTPWSKALDNFLVKDLKFNPEEMTTQTHKVLIRPYLTLKYKSANDLSIMGIWYNSKKNEFYINHIPEHNIKSKNGRLQGNYWVFSANDTINFTIEPFLNLNDKLKSSKVSLQELLRKHKK